MAKEKEFSRIVADVETRVQTAAKNAIKADAELQRLQRSLSAADAGKTKALRAAVDAILTSL